MLARQAIAFKSTTWVYHIMVKGRKRQLCITVSESLYDRLALVREKTSLSMSIQMSLLIGGYTVIQTLPDGKEVDLYEGMSIT